ncbi:MAG: hypothetical protein ACI9G1_005649, partial [Pirellulaceae bacterium]
RLSDSTTPTACGINLKTPRLDPNPNPSQRRKNANCNAEQ